MKSKINKNLLKVILGGIFATSFFILIFVSAPSTVFAALPQGAQCISTADCDAGLLCDPVTNPATCQPGTSNGGVLGDDCSSQPCQAGLTCDPASKKCAQPFQGTTGGTGAGTGAGTPCTGTSCGLTCPDNTTFSNGVCLPANQGCTGGICSSNSLSDLILKVIQLLLAFAGIIAVVFLVLGGFWYITSAGNEEQAEKGRKALVNAIIGLVVVILAYTIVTIVAATINGADKVLK